MRYKKFLRSKDEEGSSNLEHCVLTEEREQLLISSQFQSQHPGWCRDALMHTEEVHL